jgi:mRNA-degrading endonuclease RelE of RelBE toxin-antitoxin system
MVAIYQIRLPDELAELIRGLHPELKGRFKSALAMFLADPHCGKVLREELNGLRTFRVKRMRIVYRIADPQIIEVVAIGPRHNIYEETFRIISRREKN